MSFQNFSRRGFLAGSVGGALAAPLLPFVPRAAYAAGPSPKRLLVMYHPMGYLESAFFPKIAANNVDWELGESMAALASLKDKLIFLDGLENRGGAYTYGLRNGVQRDNEHGLGMAAVFTGSDKLMDGSYATGPSIDQVVADSLYAANPTKFRNIALGVNAGSPGGHSSCFFIRAGTPVNPQSSSQAAFDSLFKDLAVGGGSGAGNVEALLRAKRNRQSVIDMVRTDINALCGRIGKAEKEKCDAHLSGLRQLESRLEQTRAPSLASCSKPTAPNNADLAASIRSQINTVVAAFTCDLSRVATIQMGGADGGADPPGFEHHATTHAVGDTKLAAGPVADHKKIDLYFVAHYAYLLQRLNEVQEADGTLLDNTLVLFGSDTTTGTSEADDVGAHKCVRFPLWLAGGSNFAFKTGRALRYTTPALKKWQQHNRLLVSIAQKFGLNVDKFGTLDPGSGPLAML